MVRFLEAGHGHVDTIKEQTARIFRERAQAMQRMKRQMLEEDRRRTIAEANEAKGLSAEAKVQDVEEEEDAKAPDAK